MQSPSEPATDAAIDTPVGDFDWGPHGRARQRALPYLLIVCGFVLMIAGLVLW